MGADSTAPALFVSHGAPSEILDQDDYFLSLREYGQRIQRPGSIIIVSAHWLSRHTVLVTSAETNRLIYDFSGFPEVLYKMEYPAPGDPNLSQTVRNLLLEGGLSAEIAGNRGLDHGAWVPLKIILPAPEVPVVQISLPWPGKLETVFRLGRTLRPLRKMGVMLIGSGSMTHNLSVMNWDQKHGGREPSFDVFEKWAVERIESADCDGLAQEFPMAPNASLAHPTTEHFFPVLFTCGGRFLEDRLEFISRDFHYGTLSMNTFAFSPA